MAYTISNTDGTTLLVLADGTIDQAATSLTLIGKNYSGFGAAINNNFVKLLANSASSSSNPPRSPLTGQLWYDTTNKRVLVYDETFKTISGATVSTDKPTLGIGDFWFDSGKGQLNMRTGVSTATTVIGPLFPKAIGENGWVLPAPITVKDSNENVQDVTFLKNYGSLVGAISNTVFTTTNVAITSTTLTTSSNVVKGLNVFGDINYSGKILDRYLSMSVDFKNLTNNASSQNLMTSDTGVVNSSTWAISLLLKNTFTINTSATLKEVPHSSNSLFKETGVPPHSQARVVCSSSAVNPGIYQIRLFEANPDGNWLPKTVPSSYTATNVIQEFSIPVIYPF